MHQAGNSRPQVREGRLWEAGSLRALTLPGTCHLLRPAIFAVKDTLLDGHFVLATMSESDLHSPAPHRLVPPLQAHR